MFRIYELLPADCMISEKSRAIDGSMWSRSVMTGNATAPPPSEVIPGMGVLMLRHFDIS